MEDIKALKAKQDKTRYTEAQTEAIRRGALKVVLRREKKRTRTKAGRNGAFLWMCIWQRKGTKIEAFPHQMRPRPLGWDGFLAIPVSLY